ncbi:hypothetical protein F3157_00040 [Virgibacillus dakarensis]|uniref:Na+/H+ antiporter n=1 Tax=Lentibacillus populi TaxID=1827502 RepID=A0A9W5TU43_9BACI|nr:MULTISPECIES: hypothetical protein [Bacillaceae]MBT2214460.1 hypothetical protein [Virgibacillus dakarensis]MTW84064.1 hypothetical protein [Virgibacillus dakarensis]GGB29331.1 hypothetical protein GCM10011409_03380 [Lentibacillus populi]
MRAILIFAAIAAAVSVLYKWRYRLINTILAISFLRRMVIAITMNMPEIKEKVLSSFFKKPAGSNN